MSEILGSRLKQRNLVKADFRITYCEKVKKLCYLKKALKLIKMTATLRIAAIFHSYFLQFSLKAHVKVSIFQESGLSVIVISYLGMKAVYYITKIGCHQLQFSMRLPQKRLTKSCKKYQLSHA